MNPNPDPWNFLNTDENLKALNGKFKVEYGELHEIAMGAPIGGPCFLVTDGKKTKLSDWCGGPIVWNDASTKIALPIWTKDRAQKIAIVDVASKTITTYKKEFRVLHFDGFQDNYLLGIDSPIHRTEELNFNIDTEEIEQVKELE